MFIWPLCTIAVIHVLLIWTSWENLIKLFAARSVIEKIFRVTKVSFICLKCTMTIDKCKKKSRGQNNPASGYRSQKVQQPLINTNAPARRSNGSELIIKKCPNRNIKQKHRSRERPRGIKIVTNAGKYSNTILTNWYKHSLGEERGRRFRRRGAGGRSLPTLQSTSSAQILSKIPSHL
jgi:hypothetical protein